MAVAFDAVSTLNTFAADPTLSHVPVDAATEGVLLFAMSVFAASGMTTVTYGGTSMDLVATADGSGESEACYAEVWFLGTGVADGNQDFVCDGAPSNGRFLVGKSFTADDDIEVQDSGLLVASSDDNPQLAADLAAGGFDCLTAIGFCSGLFGVAGVTPFTGWTDRGEFDHGNLVSGAYTRDTVDSADVTAGYTAAADEVALVGIMINEIGGGSVIPQISHNYRMQRQ